MRTRILFATIILALVTATAAAALNEGGDRFDVDEARQLAFSLIGAAETDLPADVRIERRGDESMMLTEDYVTGRMTVQLDDDGTGTFRVTVLIVELPDGPETIMS